VVEITRWTFSIILGSGTIFSVGKSNPGSFDRRSWVRGGGRAFYLKKKDTGGPCRGKSLLRGTREKVL